MNKKILKKIPKFKSEAAEKKFWSKSDSTDYIDWDKAELNPLLTKLKNSNETISLKLPKSLINELKVIADKKDVPYQSLIKIILSDRVKEENVNYNAGK